MLPGVSLLPLAPGLPIEAGETLGSWQPREPPGELVAFQALAVPGFTFPPLLSASSWEAGRPRVAHASFCPLQAEQEAIWSRGASRPRDSWEPGLAVRAGRAWVERGETFFSGEAFGSHLAGQASHLIFISERQPRGTWGAGIPWFTTTSWIPVGSWGSRVSSGTFCQRRVRGVGGRSCGSRVTSLALGSSRSVGALVTVQASASLLSGGSLLTIQARGAPRAREAHDPFLSLQGDAYGSWFSLASFFTLVLIGVEGGLCGPGDGIDGVERDAIGTRLAYVALLTLFSIKTKSVVARLSFGSWGSRGSRSSWSANWAHRPHRPGAAGRPLEADQPRLSDFTPVSDTVLFRQRVRLTLLPLGSLGPG